MTTIDDLEQFDALVGTIYNGLLEAIPWQSFLPLLRERLDAKVVSLVLRPPAVHDRGLILNCLRPSEEKQLGTTVQLADPNDWESLAYKEHFFALDPFLNLPLNEVVTLAEIIPSEEMIETEYYKNYLKPAGVFHILGTDIREPSGTLARLRISRGETEAEFSAEDKRCLKSVIPHMARAIQLHCKLNRVESERDLYAGAIEKLAMGTIILDENAQVLHCNQLAQQILDQGDGLSLQHNKLLLQNSELRSRYEQELETLLSDKSQLKTAMVRALKVSRPSGKADLGLVMRPVPASEWSEGQSSPAVAIFISDPEQELTTSANTIIELFEFTKAEAALALCLAKGQTLAEASAALNISQHTARAQLKAIFAKTGVSRQAELIRLIINSVATLA